MGHARGEDGAEKADSVAGFRSALREGLRFARSHPFRTLLLAAAMLTFATVELAEVVPLLAPLTGLAVLPLLHTTQAALAVGVVLAAAYWWAPGLGLLALFLYLAALMPYLLVRLGNEPAEVLDLAVVALVGLLGTGLMARLKLLYAERTRVLARLRESEARYRTLFRDSRDSICIVSRDGAILDANQATVEFSGYSGDELQKLPVSDLYVDRSDLVEFVKAIDRRGFVRDYEVRLRRKDGAEVYCQVSATVGRDKEGNIVAYQAIIRDITDQRRMQEALVKSEQEKAAILNTMTELVTVQNMEHRVLWANRAAGQSVGLAPEQLRGRYCYEIWHQRKEPCLVCPVGEVQANGLPHQGEVVTPDGRVWWVKGYPLRGTGGETVSVMEVTLDITERVTAEAALREKTSQLENRVRELEAVNQFNIKLVNERAALIERLEQQLKGPPSSDK